MLLAALLPLIKLNHFPQESQSSPTFANRPGMANFLCQGPDSKYFWFVGLLVSVTTTPLCKCSVKSTTDNTEMNVCDCFSKTLFTFTEL